MLEIVKLERHQIRDGPPITTYREIFGLKRRHWLTERVRSISVEVNKIGRGSRDTRDGPSPMRVATEGRWRWLQIKMG